MQSSNQITEQQNPQDVNLSPDPQWIDKENGHYEWTGNTLYPDNLIGDLIGAIKFVSAPKAKEVHLSDCDNLESFEAPEATRVYLSPCGNLKTFKAPKAKDVSLSSSSYGKLESFEAPKAKRVHLSNCGNLKSFKAPEATTVNLSACHELKSFKAPEAKDVSLNYCDELKIFEAPSATKVDLHHCANLESFEAKEATEVNLSDCYKLESFEAQNATRVNLSDCHELKSFKAPEAKIVRLSHCYNLESFEAQNATKVNLSVCGNLESFKAPNATQIELDNVTQDLEDIIIKQLKNPQTLHTFMRDGQDIALDIKKADDDLNKSDLARENRNHIARLSITNGKIQDNPTKINGDSIPKELVEDMNNSRAVGIIDEFIEQKDIHRLGYKNINDQSNLSNYAKTNLAKRTHKNIDEGRGQGYKRQRFHSR